MAGNSRWFSVLRVNLLGSHLTQPFVVLKFGGTSVADGQNWLRIERFVRKALATAEHPVLVCSAVSGVTNALQHLVAAVTAQTDPRRELAQVERLHRQLGHDLAIDATQVLRTEFAALRHLAATGVADPSPQWQARVLSMGERMSTRLAAHWLASSGLRVHWVDARDLLRARPQPAAPMPRQYLSAECDCNPSVAIQRQLRSAGAQVTITQGFVASNCANETVLLGRGGSDTSAAYMAAILQAKRLEIWTDVPGLFTGDPRQVTSARLVPRLTYDEAAVLGALGANVLHPRCLLPVKAAGIPLYIRWTERPEVPGTVIDGQSHGRGVRAVTTRNRLCLVVMRRPRRWQPVGFMASVAKCFERHQLSMDLVSSSTSEIRATIDLAATPSAASRLPQLIQDLNHVCEPELHHNVMCVSIVGTAISSALGHISECLSLFADPKVHLATHAADDSHMSFVVDQASGQSLMVAVHDTLFAAEGGPAPLGARWSSFQTAPEPRVTPVSAFKRQPAEATSPVEAVS